MRGARPFACVIPVWAASRLTRHPCDRVVRYGTTRPVASWEPWYIQAEGALNLARRVARAGSVGEGLRTMLRGPGYRPLLAAVRTGLPRVPDGVRRVRLEASMTAATRAYLSAHFALALGCISVGLALRSSIECGARAMRVWISRMGCRDTCTPLFVA